VGRYGRLASWLSGGVGGERWLSVGFLDGSSGARVQVAEEVVCWSFIGFVVDGFGALVVADVC